jgi:hypothetical protein
MISIERDIPRKKFSERTATTIKISSRIIVYMNQRRRNSKTAAEAPSRYHRRSHSRRICKASVAAKPLLPTVSLRIIVLDICEVADNMSISSGRLDGSPAESATYTAPNRDMRCC